MAEYGVRRTGWDILDTNAHHSAFQRSCCLVKEMFLSNIEFRMGMGVHVLFWLATWPLGWTKSSTVSEIFRCARYLHIVVGDYTARIGNHVVWRCTFWRKLAKLEGGQFQEMLL